MDPALPIHAPPMPGCPENFSYACRCSLPPGVWANAGMHAALYPQSKLLVCNGLLVRYADLSFGRHKMDSLVSWGVRYPHRIGAKMTGRPLLFSKRSVCLGVGTSSSVFVEGVGLHRVRTLQRWWRKVLQTRCDKVMAFMMADHPRLGSMSLMGRLSGELLRLCTKKK